jgi:AraC-like DNA-binding protein
VNILTDSLPDKLHARLLVGYDDLVSELGGDATLIARRAGLKPHEPVDTYRATTRLLEAAAAELDCPDFGLRLARRQGGGSLGPLSLVMRHSRTLADALAYVAGNSQAHSLAARIWIRRRPTERAIFVGHQILLAGPSSWTQSVEQIMLLGHLGAIEMTAGAARARCVSFRHAPSSTMRVYRRYFGCETRFGEREDGIHFSESDFACPIVDTDAEAYLAATAEIAALFPLNRRLIHAEVRSHVMRLLGSGRSDHAAIARCLALHPRTLQRRLEEEGVSFQQVKDEVRREVMIYYLTRTKLDLIAISEKLGFAEQAVMSRFCQRIFAMTPTEVRARAARGDAATFVAVRQANDATIRQEEA